MAKPILKWAGGKRQIIEEVMNHFPKDYANRTYHEPMVGGGAVFFRLEPRKGTINDINKRLMNFYRVVRDNPTELIDANKTHKVTKDYFYKARDRFNVTVKGKRLDPIEEASLLLFLNRTCFNGLYRENSAGGFNVPFGKYKNPDFIQEHSILVATKLLKPLDIFDGDFNYILKKAKRNDLVYIDPPYHPLSITSSFTSYYRDDFGLEEQVRLKDTFIKLDKKGVMIVLNNSNAPQVRRLYEGIDGIQITDIRARRAINSNGSKRGEVGEIIVTNVPAKNQRRASCVRTLI